MKKKKVTPYKKNSRCFAGQGSRRPRQGPANNSGCFYSERSSGMPSILSVKKEGLRNLKITQKIFLLIFFEFAHLVGFINTGSNQQQHVGDCDAADAASDVEGGDSGLRARKKKLEGRTLWKKKNEKKRIILRSEEGGQLLSLV